MEVGADEESGYEEVTRRVGGGKGRRGGFQAADAGAGVNSKTGQHHKTEAREEEEEFGLRKTERKQDPREPSAEERLEHEKTHLSFTSWCRYRVRGRGKEEACREGKRSYDTAEVHMDLMFMGGRRKRKDIGNVGGRAKRAEGWHCQRWRRGRAAETGWGNG